MSPLSPSNAHFLVALVLSAASLNGAEPLWWEQRGVIAKDVGGLRLPASDFAAVNQGQLKNFVSAAAAELDANLPGGSGALLTATIASWHSPDPDRSDYAAANLGQVKALASLVYDRLKDEGAVVDFPWAGSSNPASDFAMVNIGQVKALFAFDLTIDSDLDGMPDWWETHNGLDSGDQDDELLDLDGDGVSNFGEFEAGTSAGNPDSDGDGVSDGLEIAAGTDPDSANPLPGGGPGPIGQTKLRRFEPVNNFFE